MENNIKSSDRVVVVGAVNIDICGKPTGKLIARDSNIGNVSLSLGGVGRNIAHNLRLLGLDVAMITALGRDAYADKLLKSCDELNIDLSDSLRADEANTSAYMFILDENGEMQLAVSDMEIYKLLTVEFVKSKIDVINLASAVVIDTNIPVETIEYICKNATCKVVVDTVSTSKAVKVANVLKYIDTIKPNVLEAEVLSQVKITDEASLQKAAKVLLDKGVKNVFITLGDKGVYYCNDSASGRVCCFDSQVVNVTGAGDCFVASVVYATLSGMDIRRRAIFASAAASIKVSGSLTINEEVSVAKVNRVIKGDINEVK